MKEALAEARKAYDLGEVPVGAVIVKDGEIIGRGHNLTETQKDPTAHAETIAIRDAASVLGTTRLTGCSMYVTIEPCAMCAGAIVWARIEKLYIGAMDKKAGACGSIFDVVDCPKLNHRVNVDTGILESECKTLMQDFFNNLRIISEDKQINDSKS